MLDTHHDEFEALRAHQALQQLILKIDQRLKAAFVWWVLAVVVLGLTFRSLEIAFRVFAAAR